MMESNATAQRDREMAALRAEGLTLQAIGDRFGISRERVRQILGPPPRRATSCERCGDAIPENRDPRALYCSRRCAVAAANDRAAKKCPECGGPCRGAICKDCKRQEWEAQREARYEQLEELWAAGLSMAEIAAQFGTTVNALGGELVRARAAGRNLPLRRQRVAKSKNLTKEEARLQLGNALRNGKIRRPRRCEECGELALVDGHHIDYQRPLCVEWLCTPCHIKAHGNRSLKEAA